MRGEGIIYCDPQAGTLAIAKEPVKKVRVWKRTSVERRYLREQREDIIFPVHSVVFEYRDKLVFQTHYFVY